MKVRKFILLSREIVLFTDGEAELCPDASA